MRLRTYHNVLTIFNMYVNCKMFEPYTILESYVCIIFRINFNYYYYVKNLTNIIFLLSIANL